MSLILVVEQEATYTERIKGALAAEGWTVQVVGSREAAMSAVAKSTPDLVLVSTEAPDAAAMLHSFARAHGGPGAMALTPAGHGAPPGSDGALTKPFTDEQLRVSVRRCLSRGQKAAAEAAAARAASAGAQLTSHDLFGDLLAEVEEEASRPVRPAPSRPVDVERQLQQTLDGMLDAPRAKAPKPTPGVTPPPRPLAPPKPAAAAPAEPVVAAPPVVAPPTPPAPMPPTTAPPVSRLVTPPPAAAPAAPTPPMAVAPPAAPSPASSAPAPQLPAPPAAPPRPPATTKSRAHDQTVDDVEDLLSQTLSGLGVGPRPRRPAAAAPPVAASPPAPTAPPREEPPTSTPVPPREEPPARPPAIEPPPPEPPRQDPPRREGAGLEGGARRGPAITPASGSPAGGFATMRIETAAPAAAPDQFGQYALLERVALGGMAEVWKARMKGVEGFQKTVAIKKILPHLTDSVDFVTMFIDEAKLAAQLSHPNIIHIYDLGKLEDDYYIAMEYVEGKDLRSILNTARRRETALPTGLALLIAARLASALDYAHRKRDFDNRELGLVHRDVSPQNVLISYEGDIKLCDFGIVKAVAKASKTQMGALKGKLQYMSPEQAWGRVVDARSDIFSLGAVLFEMLTGRRLFAGDSEISVLEAVRDCRIQSVRDVTPGISEAVDAIVRRALAKDPDDRYENAGEMQKEIETVLYSFKPTAGQGELAAYMHRLYSEEVAEAAPTVAKAASSAAAVPGTGAEVPAVAPVGGLQSEEAPRRRPWLLPAAAAAVLLVGGAAFWLTRGGSTPAKPVVTPPAGAPATAAAVVPVTAPAALPSAAPANPADMQRRMEVELKAKEEQLKLQLEEQRKKMAAELKAAQPVPSAAPTVRPAPTQVAADPTPPPAPVPTRAVEEPVVPQVVPPPAPEPTEDPVAAAPVEEEPEPAAQKVSEGDFVAPGTPGLSPPKFVSVSKPEYPPLARKLGVQGVVVLSVLVNEQGVVEQTRIVRGVAQKVGINEAALGAAKSARYRPATLAGVRVKTWANLSIPFKM